MSDARDGDMVLVPREPTPEMTAAGCAAWTPGKDGTRYAKPIYRAYKATLAAAPLSASPAAPVAGDGRTPQDFAIEFGEYLAKAAENYLAFMRQNSKVIDVKLDECADLAKALDRNIYDFRKRKDRVVSSAADTIALMRRALEMIMGFEGELCVDEDELAPIIVIAAQALGRKTG